MNKKKSNKARFFRTKKYKKIRRVKKSNKTRFFRTKKYKKSKKTKKIKKGGVKDSMTREEALHILDLNRDADLSTIKNKYRTMALIYHPDKNPENVKAAEKMKTINRAYDVLTSKNSGFHTEPSDKDGFTPYYKPFTYEVFYNRNRNEAFRIFFDGKINNLSKEKIIQEFMNFSDLKHHLMPKWEEGKWVNQLYIAINHVNIRMSGEVIKIIRDNRKQISSKDLQQMVKKKVYLWLSGRDRTNPGEEWEGTEMGNLAGRVAKHLSNTLGVKIWQEQSLEEQSVNPWYKNFLPW